MTISLGYLFLIIIKEAVKKFLEYLSTQMTVISWKTSLQGDQAMKWPFDFEVGPKSHSQKCGSLRASVSVRRIFQFTDCEPYDQLPIS